MREVIVSTVGILGLTLVGLLMLALIDEIDLKAGRKIKVSEGLTYTCKPTIKTSMILRMQEELKELKNGK